MPKGSAVDEETLARLYREYRDLLGRKSALQAFILTDRFEDLPEIDRRELREQRHHMDAYWRVLARRCGRHLPEFADDGTA
jgi:hypothetical protein